MKKMKKILAMVLAMAMVLGMSLTTFAANAKIIVNNAIDTVGEGENVKEVPATITGKQVIEEDPTTETGWKFSEGMASAFTAADAFNKSDEQAIIWSLIVNKATATGYTKLTVDDLGEGETIPEGKDVYRKAKQRDIVVPKDTKAATAAEIEGAIGNVDFTTPGDVKFARGTEANQDNMVATVNAAGMYVLDSVAGDGVAYSYNRMAAYIGFGYGNGPAQNLMDDTLNAKKIPTKAEKEHTSDNAKDNVVQVDDIVDYKITTTIPFVAAGKTFTITDTITGARYDATNNKLPLVVKVDGTQVDGTFEADVKPAANKGQTFTIDLTSLAVQGNINKTLTIEYSAVVTDTEVNNTVVPGGGDHTYEGTTDTVYTGALTINKVDETDKPLAGAEFVVYYTTTATVEGQEVSTNHFAIIDLTSKKVTGWTTNESEATPITTETNGSVTVEGFDSETTYYFKEVEAPQGYSLNEKDEPATWNMTTPVSARTGAATMHDTKLNALPSTGGIGTTIFTIGGCAIMVVAAGLFFATRKKSTK